MKKCKTKAFGINFQNPVGLAAGFDKNGDYLNFISNIGFGFVEIGTVTPRPQDGNPKPRIFRIREDRAIINHLGFNNKGVDHLKTNLKNFRQIIPIGINIGKNSTTPIDNAYQDYEYCMRQIYSLCDYISLNISSPNTKNLRDLHLEKYIDNFLKNIKKLHENLIKVYKMRVPLILKISPDLTEDQIISISKFIKRYEIEGVIATNTTINKSLLKNNKYHYFQGGLSGKPLNDKSNNIIELLNTNLDKDTTIIGVGGIDSYQTAKMKIDKGAKLLQIYTGLVYSGTNLIKEIVENL
ncbi:MAG: dihydroorotate dehydrogenase (quinone) [Gammaproteobacteria bacterium]|nr:dihydroorotate dehydrogenase (quinone) [Gammaproteobacteria bacterium]